MSLKELNLNNANCISENLALEIANVLKIYLAVKDLRLSNNNLSFNSFNEIAGALSSISSLEVLDISNNVLTEVAADAMASIISSNVNLRQLYFGKNQLRIGIKVIAKALEAVNALEVLDIVNTCITSDSCSTLAAAIVKQSLMQLKMAYNNLQSTGFTIIATRLRALSTLICLHIDSINIDSAVLENLKAIIMNNSSLEFISLINNALKESFVC